MIKLNFSKLNGLIPAVIQDTKTKEVLLVGFMNQEAWHETKKTSKVTFWSRTREKLWTKGETSGNYLNVKKIFLDCDQDTLLIQVNPAGSVCHTGKNSCFFEELK